MWAFPSFMPARTAPSATMEEISMTERSSRRAANCSSEKISSRPLASGRSDACRRSSCHEARTPATFNGGTHPPRAPFKPADQIGGPCEEPDGRPPDRQEAADLDHVTRRLAHQQLS